MNVLSPASRQISPAAPLGQTRGTASPLNSGGNDQLPQVTGGDRFDKVGSRHSSVSAKELGQALFQSIRQGNRPDSALATVGIGGAGDAPIALEGANFRLFEVVALARWLPVQANEAQTRGSTSPAEFASAALCRIAELRRQHPDWSTTIIQAQLSREFNPPRPAAPPLASPPKVIQAEAPLAQPSGPIACPTVPPMATVRSADLGWQTMHLAQQGECPRFALQGLGFTCQDSVSLDGAPFLSHEIGALANWLPPQVNGARARANQSPEIFAGQAFARAAELRREHGDLSLLSIQNVLSREFNP